MLKTLGYVVSGVSVVLLAMVSWRSASENPGLMIALLAGMATSLLGMLLRWLSYLQEERERQAKAGGGAKPPSSRSSRRASTSGVRSSR